MHRCRVPHCLVKIDAGKLRPIKLFNPDQPTWNYIIKSYKGFSLSVFSDDNDEILKKNTTQCFEIAVTVIAGKSCILFI